MIEFFVSFLMFLLAYLVKPKAGSGQAQDSKYFQKGISVFFVISGMVFMIYFVYLYFIMPAYMNDFNNSGNGLQYTNIYTNQTMTLYSSNDENLFYFLTEQNGMIYLLKMITDWWWVVFCVIFGAYGIWWAWEHNVSGEIRRVDAGRSALGVRI